VARATVTTLLTAVVAHSAWTHEEKPSEPSTTSVEFVAYLWLDGMRPSVSVAGNTTEVDVRLRDLLKDMPV
jgi:hypothetical protein